MILAEDLTTLQVERFIDRKLRDGYKKASINRYLSSLKRGFTLAKGRKPPLVHSRPQWDRLDESDNVREGFLEHEQYAALRAELPPHQQTILVIGYHFGMRSGEILSLEWSQVDWDGNLIRLKKLQTKAKKARNAPLYGDLRVYFEHLFATREANATHIVNFRGEAISETKTAWKKAAERAGLAGLLVHDLRRTAVRKMIRAGISEKRAMLISGHKTRDMLDRYDIGDERDVQEDGEKLAAYLAKRAAAVLARKEEQAAIVEDKLKTIRRQSGDPSDWVVSAKSFILN